MHTAFEELIRNQTVLPLTPPRGRKVPSRTVLQKPSDRQRWVQEVADRITPEVVACMLADAKLPNRGR